MSSSSASKAIVAASVGVVEALKDQGICRWNSALRYAGQQAKSQVRSFSQANSKLSSPSASVLSKIENMTISSAAARRGWVVAASVGVVEALKDQGICRWNYTMRLLQQHAKNQLGSSSQANKFSSPSSALISIQVRQDEKIKQSEESLRKVMYLSCWGPN
ncbi:unnamed protein product [Malus baccata var. baccata]